VSEIMKMDYGYRFCVHTHPVNNGENKVLYLPMIVLKRDDGTIAQYTGYEVYYGPYKYKHRNDVPTKDQMNYVCMALNYIFFLSPNRMNVHQLSDVTADMVFEFFKYYTETPISASGERYRGKQAVEKCVRYVSHFFANLAEKELCNMAVNDLLIRTFRRDEHSSREYEVFLPFWKAKPVECQRKELIRDIPEAAVRELLKLAIRHDPMLFFVITAQITAGLRPSEALNLRRPDSPISANPCIKISMYGSRVHKIELDINTEFLLRSDFVPIGGIKCERTVTMYPGFMEEFYAAYRFHLNLIKDLKYERNYGPLFVNTRGKALTYDTYQTRLSKLIRTHLVPKLLQADSHELQALAMKLQTNQLAPHIFRHYFSVRLVLSGRTKTEIAKYPGQEYFYDTGSDDMEAALARWLVFQLADRPSEDPTYCSLGEMAEQCSISTEELLDWIKRFPDKTTMHNGAVLVDAAFCRDVSNRIKDARTLDSLKPELCIQYPFMEKGTVAKEMDRVAQQLGENWLLTIQDLPASKVKKLSFLSERHAEVMTDMTSALDQVCAIPARTVREMTGLSLDGIAEKVQNKRIYAELIGKTYYISLAEAKRIEQICEEYMSLDVLVNSLAEALGEVTYSQTQHGTRVAEFLEYHAYWGVPTIDADVTIFAGGPIGKVIKKDDATLLYDGLRRLLNSLDKSSSEKIEYLLQEFQPLFPETVKKFRRFIRVTNQDDETTILNVLQVLFSELEDLGCELEPRNERMIREIVDAFGDVSRSTLECFSDFLIFGDYTNRRYARMVTKGSPIIKCAYSKEDFSVMVAHIVNQEIIAKKDLVTKALNCPKHASLWLYMALHIFAAWRSTDYKRLDPPHLPDWNWKRVEDSLRTGTFTEAEARYVADSFISLHDIMNRLPNKTQDHRNVPRLYFYCPDSCRAILGTILAIRWVHYQKSGWEGSFVEVVNSIEEIRRFYGEDMVKACGSRHFSGRRANKALMQAVEMTVRGDGESTAALAYLIASIVRSHKGGLDKLSETTDTYLKDGNFGNYTPEFVIEQMQERQSCSFVVDNLLELCYGASYKLLSVEDKTKCIAAVGLHVGKLVDIVHVVQQAQIEAVDVAKEIAAGCNVHDALCAIVIGNAVGKARDDICVRSAAGLECCDQTRVSCLGCKYEIKTKALLLPFLESHHNLYQKYCKVKEEKPSNHAFQEKRLLALMADVKKHIAEILTYVNSGMYGTSLTDEERRMYLELKQAVERDEEQYGLGGGKEI